MKLRGKKKRGFLFLFTRRNRIYSQKKREESKYKERMKILIKKKGKKINENNDKHELGELEKGRQTYTINT